MHILRQKLATALLAENDHRKYFTIKSPRKNVVDPAGSNSQPPDHQSDAHQTEPPRPAGAMYQETCPEYAMRMANGPNADQPARKPYDVRRCILGRHVYTISWWLTWSSVVVSKSYWVICNPRSVNTLKIQTSATSKLNIMYACHGSGIVYNPFITEFLKWTLPSLNIARTINPNRGPSLKWQQKGKQCRSWWDGSSWAVSSGSTLFAKKKMFSVCRAERVNWNKYVNVFLLHWLRNKIKHLYASL